MSKRYNNTSNYNPKTYGSQMMPKKKSGCKEKTVGSDKYITAWMVHRKVMVNYLVGAKKTGVTEKNGWITLYCKVSSVFGSSITSALKKVSTGKIYLPDLHVVMNPKTNYCGRIKKR